MTTESRCRVCMHPDRVDIERALAHGETLRDVAKRFKVGKDAVGTHLNEHADERVRQTRERRDQLRTTAAIEPTPVPPGGPWVHYATVLGFMEVVGEALRGFPSLLEEVATRVGQEAADALMGPELGQAIQDQMPGWVAERRERAERYGLSERDQEVIGRIDDQWVDAVFNQDSGQVRALEEVSP